MGQRPLLLGSPWLLLSGWTADVTVPQVCTLLDWVLSQVLPALGEQGRWAPNATKSQKGQSNGLQQAKMEVT